MSKRLTLGTAPGIHGDGTKRLTGYISRKRYAQLKELFQRYNLTISEGVRIGLNVFAAALPLLGRGGELVFREPDGAERAYTFPFLAS